MAPSNRTRTGARAGDPQSFPAVIAAYLEWLRTKNYSEQTVYTRKRVLVQLTAWLELRGIVRPNEVTRPVLERYQRYLFHYRKPDGKPLSFGSQANRLVPVRMLFQWLTRENLLLSNPAADLELPRLPHRLPKAVLSADEADRVMQAVEVANTMALRDRAILETLYSTGMRRRELVRLKLQDLDVERGTVFIREGKGGKDRIVPIGDRAVHWVERYLEEQREDLVVGRDEGFLFLTEDGGPLTPRWLSTVVRRHIARAGLEKTGSCHLFRHTMATLMLENGADIRFIQEMLGHACLSTTQVYTRVSLRKLKEIHRATHPARLVAGDGEAAADEEE